MDLSICAVTPQRGQKKACRGGLLGSGKWLTQWRKGFLNSSGPEPQGLVFLSVLARKVTFSEELLTAAAAVLDPPLGHQVL